MADIEQLTWRRAAADDAPLLFALLAAEKAQEFSPLGLSPEQLQPLLEMQFRARQLSYSQSYPAAVDMILLLGNGTPVGRHLVERQPNGYRIIDLAVLPEHRNSGIGTWALRQILQLAELEGVNVTLSVSQTNPALRLYERLGFRKVSTNELSFEMEWQPQFRVPHLRRELAAKVGIAPTATFPAHSHDAQHPQAKPEQCIVLSDGTEFDRSAVLDQIFTFLREIGLTIQLGSVPDSFLPGIQLIGGGLRVDLDTLLYPGDLLHEAGHLAVMPPDRRNSETPASTTDGGEEMAAICWSYAAALHLNLPPELVFHEHGYRGHGRDLVAGFANRNRPGLPLLGWMGLTTPDTPQQPSIFPLMLHWLREAPAEPYAQPASSTVTEEVHA